MDHKLFDENSEKVQGKKSPASTEKVQIIKEWATKGFKYSSNKIYCIYLLSLGDRLDPKQGVQSLCFLGVPPLPPFLFMVLWKIPNLSRAKAILSKHLAVPVHMIDGPTSDCVPNKWT